MNTAAEGSWTEVLCYKFIAPAPYAGAIAREGILQRIAQNDSANVILLQGPAGHGKSTALQQLKDAAEADGRLTGWLTFDAGDNDPRRFCMHFQSLLAALLLQAGESANDETDRGNIKYYSRSDWLLERLAKIGRPISLFLDEFQTLTDDTVLAFMRSLFEHAPPELRILVGSRALPDVGLTRLVVNNRALILHSDDLRFTPQEVARFFAVAGELGIDLAEIDAIYQSTDGWPAAIQLFRLSLGSPMVRKSLGNQNARAPRELAEYLAENVLALQPPRIQEFLLRTSKLTRLCASLCDAVLGTTDSREVLLQLERSGLFLRCIDPQGGWFKYHTLFSSILSDQLSTQSPQIAEEVHRRAADWYMQQRLFEETVHHATTCHEHALAADALNQWSSRLIAEAQLRTVEFWSERLPFEVIVARPDLAIKCAYALVFLRRRQRARPLLEVLQRWAGTGSVLLTTDPNIVLSMAAIAADDIPQAAAISERVALNHKDVSGFAAFELAAVANLRAYCALAAQEFESTREYLSLARLFNRHSDAAFSRGYTVAISGVALLLQGELRAALQQFEEGVRERRVVMDKSFASAALYSCYVWALYEANDLDSAESVFAQNHHVIRESMRTDLLTVAFVSMARVHDARGRPDKAEAILNEAEGLARDCGWERLVSAVKWERVRRSLLRGAIEQADSTATSARIESRLPAGCIPFADDVEDQELGEIRLALAHSDLDAAQVRIRAALKRQSGRTLRKIKLRLLLAVHGIKSGDQGAAHRDLRVALRLAQAGGFVRCVIDEGEEVLKLVRAEYQSLLGTGRGVRASSRELEFAEALLQASGTDLGRPAERAWTSLQPLTDRERELLVLLANGTSNKDVANRLFVSENTVKFHLKNIYAKLSVTSRVRAVSAARQIGIIQ